MPVPVILDCDPGHDDAFNILLAAAHPSVDLLAITTVAGNQSLEKTTLNARRVCEAAAIRDVPIAAGAAGPLHARPQGGPLVAENIHGGSGLDGPNWEPTFGHGEPTVPQDPRDALTLLRDTLTTHPAPVTLVPTGPLTNIATLLLAYPRLTARIERIVLMGGSVERGNSTPAAEFNILCDPEAADIVFGCGVPVTMFGLNATHQVRATPEVVARLAALGTPLKPALRRTAHLLHADLPRGLRLRHTSAARPADGGPPHRPVAGQPGPGGGTGGAGGDVDARRDGRRPGRGDGPAAQRGRGHGSRRRPSFWDLIVEAVRVLGSARPTP